MARGQRAISLTPNPKDIERKRGARGSDHRGLLAFKLPLGRDRTRVSSYHTSMRTLTPTVTIQVFDPSWAMWRKCPQRERMDRREALPFALQASLNGREYRLVEDSPRATVIATFCAGRRS